ncbi:MAG: protein translocase subunit SecD [Chthoniobacterales bacterium]
MSPKLVFAFGILILALFGWYFATESSARKRWLGLVLTVLLVSFCVEQFTPLKDKIRLGLDLKGGVSFLLKLGTPADQITKDTQERAVEVIRKRVDKLGVSEPDIAPQGKDRILVQVATKDEAEAKQVEALIQRVAKLEFAIVKPDSENLIPQIEAGQAFAPGYEIKIEKNTGRDGKVTEIKLLIPKRPELGGDIVSKAYPFYDMRGWGVNLELNAEGAERFDSIAAVNQYKQMAILLDGEVISAPTLNSNSYHGRAEISGTFTEKEARDLASALMNPLRVPVQIEEVRHVSATLGADSVKSGLLSGIGGIALVCVFILFYYRLAGVIALVGLAVNLVLLIGMMAMFGFVLTLPGFAGIILTIGMAVDANVLIYERLREEMASGKPIGAALNGAYEKAFSAIFDANLTTLITSIILFIEASGSVKGFAVTLTLGIIASMFAALLVTRTMFRWLLHWNVIKKIGMLDLIPKRYFDFLGMRRAAIIFSLLLIVGSFVVFAVRGSSNFGIDFAGGDLLAIESKVPVTIADARKVTNELGMGDSVVIQMERQGTQDQLTFRSPFGTRDKILNALEKDYPNNGIQPTVQESVGARIGKEFAWSSAWALFFGMLGILIYVTVRFEFSFALGALVAVLHDVIITIGLFSVTGRELSLVMVGAILTIAGYSINDTIVVFDRIREALKSGAGGSIQTLMNKAINETLGRTILTGGTTLLSVGALFIFGGEVLRDFAFAIFAGIVIGTYSSVFVAAPIVLWWSRFRGQNLHREVLENQTMRQAHSA